MPFDRVLFRLIDEGSIGTSGDQAGRRLAKVGEYVIYGSWRFAPVSEIGAGGNFLDGNGTGQRPSLQRKEKRAGAFAEDHAARRDLEWLDGGRGTEETPLVVGVAEEPVGFLGADYEAVIECAIPSSIRSSAILMARIPTAPSPTSV